MKVDTDTLRVLDGSRTEGASLFLPGQLDRSSYQRVAKVIEAAGGKWNRKAGAHLFDGDAAEAIEPILLTGEVRRMKQEFGQFDSPPAVVARVMALADIRPGMAVLEPSAGHGNLAVAAIEAGGIVHTIEIDPRRNAKLVMVIARLRAPASAFSTGQHTDFLSVDPDPVYDRVVMNPPFARQVDIDHVGHATKFLKPGGRLVAIMSAGVMFRDNRKTADFRQLIQKHGGATEPLPEDSFKESGTSVNACIVTIDIAA